MKRFFTLIIFVLIFCPFQALSSHLASGEIFYEYIGDSTGTPHEYRVILNLHRVGVGVTPGPSQTISVSSSCFPNSSFNVNTAAPFDKELPTPPALDLSCDDSSSTLNLSVYSFHYAGTVVLPGTCADFTFSFTNCCRDVNITNLNMPPNYYYLETRLNNTQEENNSVLIKTPYGRLFCAGENFQFDQRHRDPDGDSLFFELSQPLHDQTTPIPWSQGYSTYQPIKTSGGFNFSNGTGSFSGTSVFQTINLLKFRVNEYRFDSTNSQWYFAGSIDQELEVAFLNCPSPPSYTKPKFADSLNTQVSCEQDLIYMKSNHYIKCSSIAADGSDFVLYNSNNQVIPIIAAGSDSCSSLASKHFWLKLNDSVSYNDTLTLVSRVGSDQNTVINLCEQSMDEHDSLKLQVTNCTTSIGFENPIENNFRLYPNPAGASLNFEIMQASPHGKIQIISLQGEMLREWYSEDYQNSLSVDFLPSGIYFLRYTEDKYSHVMKFKKL